MQKEKKKPEVVSQKATEATPEQPPVIYTPTTFGSVLTETAMPEMLSGNAEKGVQA